MRNSPKVKFQPRVTGPSSPVTTARVEGNGTMTYEQAVEKVRQGYAPERVADEPGFPVAMLRAAGRLSV